jgi:hypothetical protein
LFCRRQLVGEALATYVFRLIQRPREQVRSYRDLRQAGDSARAQIECGSGLVREGDVSGAGVVWDVLAPSRTSPLPRVLCQAGDSARAQIECGSGLVREGDVSGAGAVWDVLAPSRTSPLSRVLCQAGDSAASQIKCWSEACPRRPWVRRWSGVGCTGALANKFAPTEICARPAIRPERRSNVGADSSAKARCQARRMCGMYPAPSRTSPLPRVLCQAGDSARAQIECGSGLVREGDVSGAGAVWDVPGPFADKSAPTGYMPGRRFGQSADRMWERTRPRRRCVRHGECVGCTRRLRGQVRSHGLYARPKVRPERRSNVGARLAREGHGSGAGAVWDVLAPSRTSSLLQRFAPGRRFGRVAVQMLERGLPAKAMCQALERCGMYPAPSRTSPLPRVLCQAGDSAASQIECGSGLVREGHVSGTGVVWDVLAPSRTSSLLQRFAPGRRFGRVADRMLERGLPAKAMCQALEWCGMYWRSREQVRSYRDLRQAGDSARAQIECGRELARDGD